MTTTVEQVKKVLDTIFGGKINIAQEGKRISIPKEAADQLERARLLSSIGLGYEDKRTGADTRLPSMRVFVIR